MLKKTLFILGMLFCAGTLFAQSDDDLFGGSFDDFGAASDEDLFGSADDDFFFDDGIDELEDVSATSALSQGVVFDDGTIKIGGSFSTSLETTTILASDDDEDFVDHLKETTLNPTASATLSVDARPTQDLRMYSKFNFAYPFDTSVALVNFMGNYSAIAKDWFNLKEMFTDFSIADRAFFRFGLHTVTWGTGYFFSPVSDIINTSSINPEKPEEQVNGSLNLRTQITIPNSQNCLWFYIIPSTDFTVNGTYARDTALAGKADILIKNWELGVGGYYKYQNVPKAMLSLTGSLKKMSIFAEGVYSYGDKSEWLEDTSWDDKTNIFQGTAGFSYMWKDPSIVLAAQYYFNGNDVDEVSKYGTYGHNLAAMANFNELFHNSDISANVFGMVNIGHKGFTDAEKARAQMYGTTLPKLVSGIFSGMLNIAPSKSLTFGMGPYVIVYDWDEQPDVLLKLNIKLGGGKF